MAASPVLNASPLLQVPFLQVAAVVVCWSVSSSSFLARFLLSFMAAPVLQISLSNSFFARKCSFGVATIPLEQGNLCIMLTKSAIFPLSNCKRQTRCCYSRTHSQFFFSFLFLFTCPFPQVIDAAVENLQAFSFRQSLRFAIFYTIEIIFFPAKSNSIHQIKSPDVEIFCKAGCRI
jgi:hypothetical protein